MGSVIVQPGAGAAPPRPTRARTYRRTVDAAPPAPAADTAVVPAGPAKPRRRRGSGGRGKRGDIMTKIGLRRKAGVLVGYFGSMKGLGGSTIMGVPTAVAVSIGIAYFNDKNPDLDAVSDGALVYGAVEYMITSKLDKDGIPGIIEILEPSLLALEGKGDEGKRKANQIRAFLKGGVLIPAGDPVNPANLPAAAAGDQRVDQLLERHVNGG